MKSRAVLLSAVVFAALASFAEASGRRLEAFAFDTGQARTRDFDRMQPTPALDEPLVAPRSTGKKRAGAQRRREETKSAPVDLPPVDLPALELRMFSFLTGETFVPVASTFASLPNLAASPPETPTHIVLDTFDAGAASGYVLPSTSWAGRVTQNATSITVGNFALNDNGWGATSLNIDATGMAFINITAQRDAGHPDGGVLSVQFTDRTPSGNYTSFSVSTSLFALGSPTSVAIAIGSWESPFDFTQIGTWSIGGGAPGLADFRMTLHHLELSATAIPEPSTIAALLGAAAFGAAVYSRRRRSRDTLQR
jgi:hypothetical protein